MIANILVTNNAVELILDDQVQRSLSDVELALVGGGEFIALGG